MSNLFPVRSGLYPRDAFTSTHEPFILTAFEGHSLTDGLFTGCFDASASMERYKVTYPYLPTTRRDWEDSAAAETLFFQSHF